MWVTLGFWLFRLLKWICLKYEHNAAYIAHYLGRSTVPLHDTNSHQRHSCFHSVRPASTTALLVCFILFEWTLTRFCSHGNREANREVERLSVFPPFLCHVVLRAFSFLLRSYHLSLHSFLNQVVHGMQVAMHKDRWGHCRCKCDQ
jgi:hypothetical protein